MTAAVMYDSVHTNDCTAVSQTHSSPDNQQCQVSISTLRLSHVTVLTRDSY